MQIRVRREKGSGQVMCKGSLGAYINPSMGGKREREKKKTWVSFKLLLLIYILSETRRSEEEERNRERKKDLEKNGEKR